MSRTYDLDRAHVFHSWSAQATLDPMVVERAEGTRVWDDQGHGYLDFSSQLVFTNIGHQHPRVVKAIQAQAAKLCTIAPQHANDARSEAAHLIAGLAPEGLERVFFTNGGAEAVEHAVRMARLHTGRIKVLSRYRSYHGGTNVAVNVTGDPRRWASDYGSAGTVHFFGPFLYRSEFDATTEEEECERALRHLRRTVELEGPQTVAAIVLETIPGTAGIMPPPPGYLAGVRELCDEHGIVMVLDEVMAGFGRTGSWLALDAHDVTPDLVTFAKGVNSGYVPLGGVIVGERIYDTFAQRVYPGGLTYSGHPLACAAAVATIETMRDERIVDNAARVGREVIGPGLAELKERHACVGDVRGLGVFWAVELVSDRETKAPLAPYGGSSPAMNEVVAACKKGGLLPFANFNRIHVVPPCTITDDEAREGLAILDAALSVGDAHVEG
ncbi:aspartate aminotransferase family protein [Nocardioides marmoribigeumensis]|uniref:Taurine--2-oxoglutarate transaminase n=1 Tax=Nocardioides marmoribigeumensis TaxID=433649 RepID=A0ABU2BSG2_9ACTN|nr:aspartate aminotransferase family protein [Nocardioides marmoribigeumensis]MDR7361583.1 taurine--2-oxoglutarate transaminase [Nocardioides marmoribigeumensis]